jgi:6-pyruvoyltetrahydropterin/6-carboxytetrahydropterin synthase
MTITCTRRLEFDAAHRVMQHESKCKNLHGHRYAVELTLTVAELDPLGRVVDFGVMKERLGAWIDAHWDHQTILWEKDKKLGEAIAAQTGQGVYYLPYNPTAENLALYLRDEICPQLFPAPLEFVKIRLQETPNCYAEVFASDESSGDILYS